MTGWTYVGEALGDLAVGASVEETAGGHADALLAPLPDYRLHHELVPVKPEVPQPAAHLQDTSLRDEANSKGDPPGR